MSGGKHVRNAAEETIRKESNASGKTEVGLTRNVLKLLKDKMRLIYTQKNQTN